MGIVDRFFDAFSPIGKAAQNIFPSLKGGNPGNHGSHGSHNAITSFASQHPASFSAEGVASRAVPSYGQPGNVGSPPVPDDSSFTPERIADRAKPIFKGGE